MPAAEVDITIAVVQSLLASQRPDLAEAEIRLLANGWDNTSFRVGEELVARLPRRAIAATLIENEARWLPELAPRLPITIPVPLFVGDRLWGRHLGGQSRDGPHRNDDDGPTAARGLTQVRGGGISLPLQSIPSPGR